MTAQSIDMEKYYNCRKELAKLYKNDTVNTGNLACKVLEIRDKSRVVNSINLELQEGKITVEVRPETTAKKKDEIINKIRNCIGRYIVDNKYVLDENIAEDQEFNNVIIDGCNFCEVYNIGDEIVFGLF